MQLRREFIRPQPPSSTKILDHPFLLLNNLICEGTRLGFHVVATCDTKGEEALFIKNRIAEQGLAALVIDTGVTV